jgi:hypothetical protein
MYIITVLTPFVDKPFIFFHPQVWKNLGNIFLIYVFIKGIWFGAQNEVFSCYYRIYNTFDIVDLPILSLKHFCSRKWCCPWIMALSKRFIILLTLKKKVFLQFHHPHWWYTSSVGATNVGNLLRQIKVIVGLLHPHMDKSLLEWWKSSLVRISLVWFDFEGGWTRGFHPIISTELKVTFQWCSFCWFFHCNNHPLQKKTKSFSIK